jgi:hypothetical protein
VNKNFKIEVREKFDSSAYRSHGHTHAHIIMTVHFYLSATRLVYLLTSLADASCEKNRTYPTRLFAREKPTMHRHISRRCSEMIKKNAMEKNEMRIKMCSIFVLVAEGDEVLRCISNSSFSLSLLSQCSGKTNCSILITNDAMHNYSNLIMLNNIFFQFFNKYHRQVECPHTHTHTYHQISIF